MNVEMKCYYFAIKMFRWREIIVWETGCIDN